MRKHPKQQELKGLLRKWYKDTKEGEVARLLLDVHQGWFKR